MITQSQLDADKAAVAAAQAQLDKDQAEFDTVQPILTELANVAEYVQHLAAEVQAEFTAAVQKVISLL